MRHALHRVTGFDSVGDFTLQVRFDDGSEQVIDFYPVLVGEIYGPLSDPELFRKAALDPETHTIVWPNGADFDPAQLHDWPQVKDAFAALARTWGASERATALSRAS